MFVNSGFGLRWLIACIGAVWIMSCSASSTDALKDESGETRDPTEFAVLVGVTSYPFLENKDLIGPKNDVLLMQDVLLERGFKQENIRLLVDDVTGASEPTYQNIMASLKHVVQKANKGDYVYLHFAGHGSQAPAKITEPGVTDELDGLDEIFLPKDVKGWNYEVAVVANSITDNEIGSIIEGIRKKGAFVWAVFDSCHSGTMTRSLETITMRKVLPNDLGIPSDLIEEAQSKTSLRSVGSAPAAAPITVDGKGGYVAFFAAQTNQQTPEMLLPRGAENRANHGLFTYFVSQAIASANGKTSYRQAAEQILQNYNSYPYRRATPLFEGDLDSELLGQATLDQARQWKITPSKDGLLLDAGSFHEITKDSILAVVPGPTVETPIGYAQITKAEPLKSSAMPIEYNGLPALSLTDIPSTAFARIEQSHFSISVRYAYEQNSSLDDDSQEILGKLRSELSKTNAEGLALEEVSDDESADIRLFAIDSRLYFLSDDEDYPCVGDYASRCDEELKSRKFISIDLTNSVDELSEQVVGMLRAIGKANNLRRLAQKLGASERHLNSSFTQIRDGETVELASTLSPEFKAGDKLEVVFSNKHVKPIDVNMFIIDSDYGVTKLFPSSGQSPRLLPKQTLPTISLTSTSNTIGQESILVLAVEASRNSAYTDFSFLEQSPLLRTRTLEKTRGNGDATSQVLDQLAFGAFGSGTTVRGMSVDVSEPVFKGVELFNFTTVPK